MKEPERESAETGPEPAGRKPYAPPAISWEEEYRPAAFGLSCSKQPGDPACTFTKV